MDGSHDLSSLQNIGTSLVFYTIIDGKTTPKAISDILKIRPPAVIEQLRRLQKSGLVKLGKKNGKFQHYEIDRENLVNIFLSESMWKLQQVLTQEDFYPDPASVKKQLKKSEYYKILKDGRPEAELTRSEIFSIFQEKLRSNSRFADYLIEYMKLHIFLLTKEMRRKPIWYTIVDFEEGLRLKLSKILDDLDPKEWDLIDESKRELLKILHIWSLLLQKLSTMEEDVQEFAIREFVGPKIWEKIEE